MSKKKILIVFGTRPEAIKICPVINELKRRKEFATIVAVTGQHREMLDQVLKAFSVIPDFDLAIMKESQSLFDITINVIEGIKDVIIKVVPDVVLVHGDTSTAFATALAAYYLQIPVGHVEAGLRTNNIYSPFPEEFNREAVSLITEFHFAPTKATKANLIKEGKLPKKVYVTGNTVIDALKTTVIDDYSHPDLEWAIKADEPDSNSRFVLFTAHRRENLGEPMKNMFRAVKRVLNEHRQVKLVYPVHLNPVIQEIAMREFGDCPNIRLIKPLDVLDFHNFMSRAYLILTDSGGVQEEAASLGKPVLVMRDTTERPEGIETGVLKLVGTEEKDIYREFGRLLTDPSIYKGMSSAENPYGDGQASVRIADILRDSLTK